MRKKLLYVSLALSLVCTSLSLIALLFPFESLRGPHDYLLEHLDSATIYSEVTRQRAAHLVWIATVSATAIVMFLVPANIIARSVAAVNFHLKGNPALLISVSILATSLYWAIHERSVRALVLAIVAIALVFVILPKFRLSFHPLVRKSLFGVFLGGYFAAMFVPGLISVTSVDLDFLVRSLDYHFAVVLGSVDRLRDPNIRALDLPMTYGVLSNWTAAKILNITAAETVGSYIRLIQWFGVVFAAVLMIAAWNWSGRNKLFTTVVALVGIVPVSSLFMSSWHPNQSGWRMLGFALFLLMIPNLSRLLRSEGRPFVIGVAAAFLLLWNQETGIACAAGLLFLTIMLEYRTTLSVAAAAASAVAMLAVTAAVSFSVILLVRGGIPAVDPLQAAAGYGGLRLEGNLVAFAIAIAATCATLRTILAVRFEIASLRDIEHGAIGVTLLVWFAYFMARPHMLNLWSSTVLSLFLFERIFSRSFWVRWAGASVASSPITMAMLLFVFYLPISRQFEFARYARFPDFSNVATVSGLFVPEPLAEIALKQADAIKEFRSQGSVVFLTSLSFLMARLSGEQNGLSVYEPFGEAWTESRARIIRKEISDKRPDFLLIDAPDNVFLNVERERFAYFQRLRNSLSPEFVLIAVRNGWQVWSRVTSSENAIREKAQFLSGRAWGERECLLYF